MTEDLSECRSLAERAAKAAEAGRIDEARRGITEALAGAGGIEWATDLTVLFLAFQFHFRQGELEFAERLCRRRIVVAEQIECESGTRDVHLGRAWCNLGLTLQYAARLDESEAALRRAIELDGAINHEEGVARDLGTLALVFEARKDLDAAERLYLQALSIGERIGAEAIIATDCGNLGEIALARGDREKARALLTRSVEILTRLGSWKVKGVAETLAALDETKEGQSEKRNTKSEN
jgi:tetratricopeptide (TPR) repeat protein